MNRKRQKLPASGERFGGADLRYLLLPKRCHGEKRPEHALTLVIVDRPASEAAGTDTVKDEFPDFGGQERLHASIGQSAMRSHESKRRGHPLGRMGIRGQFRQFAECLF